MAVPFSPSLSLSPSVIEDLQRGLLALMLAQILIRHEFGPSDWDAVADDSFIRGFEGLRVLDPAGTFGVAKLEEKVLYCNKLYNRLGMCKMRVDIDLEKYGDRKIVVS